MELPPGPSSSHLARLTQERQTDIYVVTFRPVKHTGRQIYLPLWVDVQVYILALNQHRLFPQSFTLRGKQSVWFSWQYWQKGDFCKWRFWNTDKTDGHHCHLEALYLKTRTFHRVISVNSLFSPFLVCISSHVTDSCLIILLVMAL